MTKIDVMMYAALIGQALGAAVGVVCVVIMFKRRAKERREKTESQAGGLSIPPAARGPDRPDWRGAPAGKPR
jgi:glycerol uptake facilitator-like aquaporin